MHIVVCIKQVPDSAQIRVHPVTNTIMRQGVPAIINPYDLYALEEALRLKDQYGGHITVLTMGPPMAEGALRKAISYGADDAVLVTDRIFAGSDTLATSYALSTAISQIHKNMAVDMVFTGKQTIDGDTAQVGPGIAKRLNMQLLTYVSRIGSLNLETKEILVERRSEGGVQVLKSQIPCLITILEGNNDMRFATMNNMFRASRFPVKIWNGEQAGIVDLTKAGLKGSPTVVAKVFAPTPRSIKAEIIQCESNESKDLSATLLTKLFTKYPKLEREIVSSGASI